MIQAVVLWLRGPIFVGSFAIPQEKSGESHNSWGLENRIQMDSRGDGGLRDMLCPLTMGVQIVQDDLV